MQYTPLISGGLALTVIPSDDANIPYPNKFAEGISLNSSSDQIIDAGQTFKSTVNVGDIVYNTTTLDAATVINVVSDTELTLNAGVMTTGDSYIVYCGSGICEDARGGCVIRVNATGNVTVTTMSGEIVLFTVQAGEYLPVRVTKVAAGATATGIVAIW